MTKLRRTLASAALVSAAVTGMTLAAGAPADAASAKGGATTNVYISCCR